MHVFVYLNSSKDQNNWINLINCFLIWDLTKEIKKWMEETNNTNILQN